MATDTAFLKQRRQTWYFQIAVPRDLQKPLGEMRNGGKPVPLIVESLKTRDKSEAQRLRWEKHRDAMDLFDRLRGRKALTLAEIEEAAEATFREFLRDAQEAAEKGRRIGWAVSDAPDSNGEADEYGGLEVQLGHLQDVLGEGAFSEVEGYALHVIAKTGADVPKGSRAHKELCQSQLRALIEATKGRMAFLRGEAYEPVRPFTTPIVDPVTLTVQRPTFVRKKAVAANGEKFTDAAARYVAAMMRDADAAWTMQTKHQNEATFRLFGDYLNGASVASVMREDASKFLDAIAALHPDYGRSPASKGLSLSALLEKHGGKGEGLTNKTLNRHTTALNGFFKWAKQAGIYSGDNPFSGLLRQTGRKSATRWLPLNTEELKQLVNAPLLRETPYKDRVTPEKHSMATAMMWVPLVALYSGMRSEEICQLRTDDVKREQGVWYFNVTDGDGRRVKTEASVRKVPVHSALIRAGLLEYVKHAKRDPSGQIFPGLSRGGPDRKFNWYFTKAVGARFEALGITRDRVTFHSLRKNVGTALERARVPESEVVQVLGHEKMSMSYSVYSLGLELGALRNIVEKIRYPGLDLSHIQKDTRI
jgi:integrase